MRVRVLTIFLLGALAVPAGADILLLTDGRIIEGHPMERADSGTRADDAQ